LRRNYEKIRKRKTDWQRNNNRKNRDKYNAKQREMYKKRKERDENRAEN
jgi:hypothetical protein